MPVRTITPRRGSIAGWFPSFKLQRMVRYESTLERDCLYLLDFDPAVIWFEEQPIQITYEYAGKTHRYTPDFQVIRGIRACPESHAQEQCELIECKPERLAGSDENQRKFDAARHWCAHEGWRFTVQTETLIRGGFRLGNAKQLSLYARIDNHEQARVAIIEHLSDGCAVGLESLVAHVAERVRSATAEMIRGQVLRLAFQHMLHIPVDDAPLSPTSMVTLASISATGARS